MSLANEARVEVDAEVFGLFRDIIPAAALGEGGELETVRGRSGKVPDFQFCFPVDLNPRPRDYHPPRGRRPLVQRDRAPEAVIPLTARPSQGPPTWYLAELKCINAGPSRYPRTGAQSRDKAVNRRARLLPGEYKGLLDKLDQRYWDTPPGVAGPLVQRLLGMGTMLELVVGSFGEVSTDMERVIVALAESRALYLSREAGRTLSGNEIGVTLGQYRRLLSVTFVRSNAACLLARMGHLGEMAQARASRRNVATAEEGSSPLCCLHQG